jgi:hypothetical protein
MLFSLSRRFLANTSCQNTNPSGHLKKLFNKNKLLKSTGCALILIASPSVFADTHFGFGLSDGDKKVTWVQKAVSVSDELATKIDTRWNAKEEDFFTDVDYDTYLKSFKLYMVFKRNF